MGNRSNAYLRYAIYYRNFLREAETSLLRGGENYKKALIKFDTELVNIMNGRNKMLLPTEK